MELPTRKATLLLSIIGASSVCTILLVFIATQAIPKILPSPTLKPITLDPARISAKAAALYDPLSKRILFAKNEDEQLPLASLTKLMAAAAILGTTDTNSVAIITKDDLKPEGDSRLKVGEKWNLDQLIKLGLVASSNDAMAAAAARTKENITVAMNRLAGELSLTRTYFLNSTGLDLSDETSGAYGSARDVAVLAAEFLKRYPTFLEATANANVAITSEHSRLIATSTASPLISYPGFIGAKTGYTDLAGGNLVAVFDLDIGHPVVVAVLGSTREGRFTDVLTIINAAREQQ